MRIFTALALVCAAVCSGCTPHVVDEDGRYVVAVTILPQQAFVEAVGGNLVDVLVMVPPGAEPHTYEVTPDQMVKLSHARVYARVGPPMEFEVVWMDKLIAANPQMQVVDCSRGLNFIEGVEDNDGIDGSGSENAVDQVNTGADPHIWLSVRNAEVMVENIRDGLSQYDPANADYYAANCAAYVDALKQLDLELTRSLQGLVNRTFIVYHPAFGYFARDYNLTQLAIEQGGNEPDAQYLVRLIDTARQLGIRVVFVAPEFSSRSAEVVADEIGGRVVAIDPLAEDYIPNMRSIASAIEQAI